MAHLYDHHPEMMHNVAKFYATMANARKGGAVRDRLPCIVQDIEQPAQQVVHVLIVTYTEPLETVRCDLSCFQPSTLHSC
jgi:hypothetical protein